MYILIYFGESTCKVDVSPFFGQKVFASDNNYT